MDNVITLELHDSRKFIDIMNDLYSSKLFFEIRILVDKEVEFKAFSQDGKFIKYYKIHYDKLFGLNDYCNKEFLHCCFYNNSKAEAGFFKLALKSKLVLQFESKDNERSTTINSVKIIRYDDLVKVKIKAQRNITLSEPKFQFISENDDKGNLLFEFDLGSPYLKQIKKAALEEIEIFSQKREQNNFVNLIFSAFNIPLRDGSKITKYNDEHIIVKFSKEWLKFFKKNNYHVKIFEKIIVFECSMDNSTILLKDFEIL
jgi:hypothetical protein